MFNNRYKRQLLDKINKLSNTEHEEIFKILCEANVSFTPNKNGVFFNLSMIDDEVVKNIEQFVSFCLKNKTELDEYDKKLNECKLNKNYEGIISNSCDNKIQGSLSDILNIKNQNKERNDWAKVINENQSKDKLINLVEMLESNLEKLHKKRTNTKFINAKKRYSRKLISDKKIEIDVMSELIEEEYLVF